jgi:tetratricopeptide (TPR) repeat protein
MSITNMKFIGHEQEIEFLSQWIVEKNARPIVYIHDEMEEAENKGGIGKTWLLREFHTMMEQQEHVVPVRIIDFFNVLNRDNFVIAERFVQTVKERYPYWSSENVNKLILEYRDATQRQNTRLAVLREQLADAIAADLRLLHQQMVETDTYLLLFFDTYELIEYNPISAVLRPSQMFPDRYQSNRVRAIIAGRNAIDWTHQNWIGREKEVNVRPLPPFDLYETEQYLQDRLDIFDFDSLSSQMLQALYEKTRGRPILLGLVSDVLNKRLKTPDELIATGKGRFEASLVEEINNFPDTSKWVIFTMAHIYHRFDAAFLERLINWPGLRGLVSYPQFQELVEELPRLSFVRRADTDEKFVLHDEMRRLVNTYCWEKQDSDKRIRRELSKLAISHYDELLNREEDEEKRQSYIVEKLYHELFLDNNTGFQSFESHFNHAIDRLLRAFARILLQELQKFEMQLSEEQRLTMQLAETQLLREEEKAAAALDILNALEQHAVWAERNRYDLLFEKGSCHLRLSQYPQAIACFEACLHIAEENKGRAIQALLLNRLGYTHRLQGRYADAVHYYEEAINVQRSLDDPDEYANLLNNISNVLRFQGRLEDALRYCKLGLRIRRDRWQQGKLPEYYVGLSLSMLGHINHVLGEVSEEENAYREAFKIYNRVGDKRAIAATYNCFGRLWMKKGDLKSAREALEQAALIASGVSRDAEIENYNQRGRLALMEEKWSIAREFFEQAIALSRQVGLEFHLAENLLFLADALDRAGFPWLEQIKAAKRIARQNNYTYLLARAGEVQGDMFWRKQEYQSAFKYYRGACRYMAMRGFPEYNRMLRKLYDLLLEIPSNFLPGVIDLLLSYWFKLELDKTYPQVPEICREVSRHMLL